MSPSYGVVFEYITVQTWSLAYISVRQQNSLNWNTKTSVAVAKLHTRSVNSSHSCFSSFVNAQFANVALKMTT